MSERRIDVTEDQLRAWLGLPPGARVNLGIPLANGSDKPGALAVYTDAPVTAPRTSPLTGDTAYGLASNIANEATDDDGDLRTYGGLINLIAAAILRVDSEARAAERADCDLCIADMRDAVQCCVDAENAMKDERDKAQADLDEAVRLLRTIASESCDCGGVGAGHVCPYVAAWDWLRDYDARHPTPSTPTTGETEGA